jgi:hypothetical protein
MGVAIGTDIILPPCLTHMRLGDSGDGLGEKPCHTHMDSGGPRTISAGDDSGEKTSIRRLWCLRTGSFNLLIRIGGGRRFLSPDGSSWLAVYASLTAAEPIASHMQSIAFAEGETLTYLRGERDWIVVSGTKGDRFFYRKAVIACGGKVWHHMAFEYPAERKQAMDAFVIRAAAIIDLAENDGCEEATSSFNPDR